MQHTSIFYRYETMTRQGKLVVFLSNVEVSCCGKVINKKIGKPFEIKPDGYVVLPEILSSPSNTTWDSPRISRSQPEPTSEFSHGLKTPPARTTGVTPKLAKFRFKQNQKKGKPQQPDFNTAHSEEPIDSEDVATQNLVEQMLEDDLEIDLNSENNR